MIEGVGVSAHGYGPGRRGKLSASFVLCSGERGCLGVQYVCVLVYLLAYVCDATRVDHGAHDCIITACRACSPHWCRLDGVQALATQTLDSPDIHE